MKILGHEHNKRETIYLFLILILLIGFFLSIYAQELTINAYKRAYNECNDKIIEWNDGKNLLNVWGELPKNITIGDINVGNDK